MILTDRSNEHDTSVYDVLCQHAGKWKYNMHTDDDNEMEQYRQAVARQELVLEICGLTQRQYESMSEKALSKCTAENRWRPVASKR